MKISGSSIGRPVIPILLAAALMMCPAKVIARSHHGSASASHSRVYTLWVTAYTPVNGNGKTSMGKRARRGTIAVDPHFIPMGTRMYVQGYGYGRAGDYGAHMRGRRIDICVATRHKARAWGRRKVKVRVYR